MKLRTYLMIGAFALLGLTGCTQIDEPVSRHPSATAETSAQTVIPSAPAAPVESTPTTTVSVTPSAQSPVKVRQYTMPDTGTIEVWCSRVIGSEGQGDRTYLLNGKVLQIQVDGCSGKTQDGTSGPRELVGRPETQPMVMEQSIFSQTVSTTTWCSSDAERAYPTTKGTGDRIYTGPDGSIIQFEPNGCVRPFEVNEKFVG